MATPLVNKFKPRFAIVFAGTDVTADVADSVISLEYSDYLDGQSDEVTVELYNQDLRWCKAWYPQKGDALEIGLGYHDGEFVKYPDCELDAPEYSFKPDVVRLKALSTGVSKSVRTRKPKLYKDITLADLARTIAKRNKLALTGTVADIKIDKVSQYMERDLEFLLRVAKIYNHTLKIVGTKLVFTNKPDLGAQPAVRLIDYEEVLALDIREKLKDIVGQIDVAYQNPKTKKKQVTRYRTKAAQKKAEDKKAKAAADKKTASGDTLKIARRGGDNSQTAAQAQAAMSEANEDRCTGDLVVLGDPKLVAGVTIELTGIGELSGKYLINCSRHVFSRSEGYTTSCEIRRVESAEDTELEEVPENE